ncbi:cuticle protein 12.5-like [Anopheles maculipalpis]|uniref:cuticle protein 12.5-like n=1 Tax=Anopheles maculipalpis TaxID=1496333 RepID=UPI002158FCA4|nr:cuticle protein 12.5-like [Anopheles maculipalpis]
MFSKVMIVAMLAVVASVSAKPGAFLPGAPLAYTAAAPLAYSAPLAVAPAAVPAVAYTAGYANVGDSAVVTSHNSQVINPAYAAYSAAPLVSAYAAAPALAAPFAYSAPLAAKYVL